MDHLACAPVSAATVRMYAAISSMAVFNAAKTILHKKPNLVFPWADGLDVLDQITDGTWEWGQCTICHVLQILWGPARLPLMVGLLLLTKKTRMYARCLKGIQFDMGVSDAQELDSLFHELAEIHLKYTSEGEMNVDL